MHTDQMYALKVMKSDLSIEEGQKEKKILQTLNHPNIIKTVDFYEDTHLYNYKGKKSKNRYNFLVLELAVGDTLFEYLMKGEFSHPVARFYFKQLISAL